MKLQTYVLFLFCFASNIYPVTETFSPVVRIINTREHDVSKPIIFTQAGIDSFFKNQFSSCAYAREFLPYSFEHFTQLLEHGTEKDKSTSYFITMIRLFTNRVKAAPFVTIEAFATMTSNLIPLLENPTLVKKNNSSQRMKKTITDLLYDKFLSHFALFKAEPDTFLHNISEQIVYTVEQSPEQNEDSTLVQLRTVTILLIEHCINKLIWAPADQEKTWAYVKKVARNITQLNNQQIIINPTTIDDLLTSLIERYCYFIELTHSDLSLEFFIKIKNELASNCPKFLQNTSPHPLIKTTLDRLMNVLTAGEARIRAQEYGLCSNDYEKLPKKQRIEYIESLPMPKLKNKRIKKRR